MPTRKNRTHISFSLDGRTMDVCTIIREEREGQREIYVTTAIDPNVHLSAHDSGKMHFRKRGQGGRLELDERINERAPLEHPVDVARALWGRTPRREVYWIEVPSDSDAFSIAPARLHVDLDRFSDALGQARKVSGRRAISLMGSLRAGHVSIAFDGSLQYGFIAAMDEGSWVIIPAGSSIPTSLRDTAWWKEIMDPLLKAHDFENTWPELWAKWITNGTADRGNVERHLRSYRRMAHRIRNRLRL